MAEGLLNHYGKEKILAFSAGSHPTGKIHPTSLAILKRHGIRDHGYRSKSWDEFKDYPVDVLITVCDNAAGEICPVFLGNPVKIHWGVPDPALFQGSPTDIDAEFERIFSILDHRVKAFLSLPLEQMDKAELKKRIHEKGRS